MSVEAMTIALHHSRAKGTTKVVLLGIANHEGDGGAWPSIATLAKYANVSERSVQRAIDELEDLGEVQRASTDERDGALPARIPAHLRPNLYKFLLVCPTDCDRTTNHRTTDDRARAAATRPAVGTGQPHRPEPSPAPARADETAQAASRRTARLAHPERCGEHQDTEFPPPCGACARARGVMEAAQAERARQERHADAERRKADQAERARLRRIEIAGCDMCDGDGRWPNGMPCDHNPLRAETNRRGREQAEAALAGARA